MRATLGTLFVVAVVSAAFPLRAAEEDAKAPLFAEPKKDWAWDEDKRFDFLIERLASVEASLDAVNAAISKVTGKKSTKLGEARRAEENNTLMDRKGGGPMKWDEFYGTNAEKFFYHPVDPNTTYRTDTFLRQMGKGEDDKYESRIPSRQSVPVHQRPPQFDYIYKANEDARGRAEEEAAKLAGKVETLTQRRIELEREQAELWCLLAFRAIQKSDIPRKPVLRFQLVSATGDTADVQKAEALAAAARFLATALLIIEKAEDDQATAFGNVKDIVTRARNDFDDALLNTDAVAEDVTDKKTTLGKYVALSKLLDDTSSNLSESYEVAMEGDRSQDLARKDRFRGLLQRSLVEYAQIVLALDELAGVMKADWKVKVDTKNKAHLAEVSWGPARVQVAANPGAPEAEAKSSGPEGKPLWAANSLKGWAGDTQFWRLEGDVLVGEEKQSTPRDAWIYTKEKFKDFKLTCDFRLYEGNSGIMFAAAPNPNGGLSGLQADIAYEPDMKWMGCLGFHGLPGKIVYPTDAQRRAMLSSINKNDWNNFVIMAKGKSIMFAINGVEVLSTTVEGRPAGAIGFQLWNKESTKIAYRNAAITILGQ